MLSTHFFLKYEYSVCILRYLNFSVFRESSDLLFDSIYSKKVNYNRSYLPLKWPVVWAIMFIDSKINRALILSLILRDCCLEWRTELSKYLVLFSVFSAWGFAVLDLAGHYTRLVCEGRKALAITRYIALQHRWG